MVAKFCNDPQNYTFELTQNSPDCTAEFINKLKKSSHEVLALERCYPGRSSPIMFNEHDGFRLNTIVFFDNTENKPTNNTSAPTDKTPIITFAIYKEHLVAIGLGFCAILCAYLYQFHFKTVN